jgi:hypothetical protein
MILKPIECSAILLFLLVSQFTAEPENQPHLHKLHNETKVENCDG